MAIVPAFTKLPPHPDVTRRRLKEVAMISTAEQRFLKDAGPGLNRGPGEPMVEGGTTDQEAFAATIRKKSPKKPDPRMKTNRQSPFLPPGGTKQPCRKPPAKNECPASHARSITSTRSQYGLKRSMNRLWSAST